MSILKLENVGYRYKDAPKDSYVFKNVNYEFEQGKMYAIKGKSGSGKTTLLSLDTMTISPKKAMTPIKSRL